ncbi:branched-chain amino acid ABC transporter permease [Devosia sp. SL43]|uniref:branched-chain amino acid ABC transporter permease n=1 Tax=Devosia sp. SL43 TaxID=2806348 RepID=UPI001F3F6F13|nr:branched-chain amino acid ABC transporter permease [Devosia sp. SL43]UJW87488.1 branched-chain amino acid ABC transporter permease [Devosia sp. SL43]
MKFILAFVALAAFAFVPSFAGAYPLGLGIGILGYGVLATAWAMFSGPTRYISLATVAFFGLGAYTVAVLGETMPYPLILVVAALVGLVVALIVGLATLRLAGIYFVIFTFGLTELVRQLVTYYEVNVTRTLGRYVFLPLGPEHIYWQLLALLAATLAIAFWARQSRIGLALRVIGDDPVVASHLGVRITRTKLTLFSISCVIMTLAGAIQAPRWTYIEPSIVFNPTTSFLVVIMALLGGPNRLLGPLLGAIPLFLLFEWLSANFPNHYSIILGLLFIAIVFVLPNGVLAAGESLWARINRKDVQQ